MRALFGFILVVLAGAAAPAAEPPLLTPERMVADPALSGTTPRSPAFSPEGSLLTVLRGRPDNANRLDLWAYDVETGEARMLVDSAALAPSESELSEEEKARRERRRVYNTGIVEYAWDARGEAVIVPLGGDVFHVSVTSDAPVVSRLTETEAFETDAQASPTGRYVGYVREQTLWAYDFDVREERQISPGGGDAVSYGVAEFVAQEEMRRFTGYWFSPDDSAIAYAKVDESEVDILERFDIGADGVTVVEQRYPRAGTTNAQVELIIQSLDGSDPVTADLGENKDIYLARVDWLDANSLIVQRQNRAQNQLDVLKINAQSGEAELLFSETSDTWINLNDDFTPIEGGKRFLWTSERDGYAHIYLYDATGALIRQVTSGEWPVADSGAVGSGGGVVGVNEQEGLVYFTGFMDTWLERHLYVVSYETPGQPRRLTDRGAYWAAAMNARADAFIGASARIDQPRQTGLYRPGDDDDAELVFWLEENALDDTHPYAPYLPRHVLPSFGSLRAADGKALLYELYTPQQGCSKEAPCPAIQLVYGGPGAQRVSGGWAGFLPQLLVQRGYVVFEIDNRGATNRGKAFEDVLHRRLGAVEVEDQLEGLDYLKSRDFVDEGRVGVFGWSYGGYMTLMLLGQAPGAFAAGISGAPVTDWTLYDTHYTERYLSTPQDNPEGYAASSVFPTLGDISDPMLIIHGMADDNVVFENTTRVLAELQASNTAFETMLYPGQRHRITGPGRSAHMLNTVLRFFDRHLAPHSPSTDAALTPTTTPQ